MKYTENYQPKALQENAKFLQENIIVKLLKLLTGTAGAAGGGAILDIVPTKDSLIVEAKLPNSDIGFVKPGQSAVVKLSSSDSVNFGQINGTK